MATTRQVSAGASITAAIDSSVPGDAVMLRANGTHSGFSMAKPGVRVYGENPDVTVAGHVYVRSTGDDGEIDHLVLTNGSNTGRTNPTVDAQDLHFHHNVIDNENKSIALHLGGDSTNLAAHRAIVEHNVFKNVGRKPWTNYDHAIYMKWADDVIIRHNQFLDGGDYAVHFWAGWARRAQIYNNYMDDSWAGAVIFGGNASGGSDNAALYKNIVTGPPRSGRQVIYGYQSGWTGAQSSVTDNLFVGAGPFLISTSNVFYTAAGNVIGDPQIVNGKITNPAFLAYGPDSMRSGPVPPPDPDPADCSAVQAELDAARAQIAVLQAANASLQANTALDVLAFQTIRDIAAERRRL